MGPWKYGDGAGGSTLHWVYTGVGARPATEWCGYKSEFLCTSDDKKMSIQKNYYRVQS